MTARRWLALAALSLVIALFAGRFLAGAYGNWAFYSALGAEPLWRVRTGALATLRAVMFVASFAFAFANLLAMRRSIVSLVLPRRMANLEIGEAVPGPALTAAAALLSLLVAAAVSLPQDDWLGLVRLRWARTLGESDPYLNHDIAYWTAWLPFERTVHAWAVTLAAVVGGVVILLYALTPSVQVRKGQLQVSTWVRRHVAVYTALLLVLIAWGYRLDTFDLLIHGSGVRGAFVAFDYRVMYPYLSALVLGTVAVALLVAWTGWMGYKRAMLGALLLALVAGPMTRIGLPLLDRRTATERERSSLDRSYLHVRTLYTRRAFAIDEIVRGAAADSLSVPESAVAQRVSGWDPCVLARAVADEPGAELASPSAVWHVDSGGALRASVAYGDTGTDEHRRPLLLQVVDVADADERGAPWPSVSSDLVNLPPLAVGVGLGAVRVVSDTLGRVAAPHFSSGWRRLALAWSVRRLQLAFGEPASANDRLMMRRNVRERVGALLPFFALGATPQAFLARDSLWWSLEVFNAGDYPLTEPVRLAGETVRFAVPAGTAVVNAHSGRVIVVLPRRPDKMTRWWSDRLPELFVSWREANPVLTAALPPPVDRALVQGRVLAHTGFRDDTLALRPIADSNGADSELMSGAPAPYASGDDGTPLAWAMPAVDGLDRLRGALVAVGGASPHTAFVERAGGARWPSLLDRIQSTADEAGLNRPRRHPRRGRVQVIPTASGLLVLQSFYEWRPDRAPSLAGTVVAHDGRERAGASLAAAFGAPPRASAGDSGLRLQLARIYAALAAALRRGDWPSFGRAMADLQRLAVDR